MKRFLIALFTIALFSSRKHGPFHFFSEMVHEIKDTTHEVSEKTNAFVKKMQRSINTFIKDKIDKIGEILKKHQELLNLKQQIDQLKATIEVQRKDLDQAAVFKNNLDDLKSQEEKIIQLLESYQRNVQIQNVQHGTSDPQLEQVLNDIVTIHKEDKTVGSDDLKQVDDSIEAAKTVQGKIETDSSALNDKLNDLSEKVNDIPDLLARIENHIDNDTKDNNVLQPFLDQLSILHTTFLNPGVNEIAQAHKRIQELTTQQYENLKNLKIVEDGVNERQTKQLDRSQSLLGKITQTQENGSANPELGNIKTIIEHLTEVYE